MARLWCNTAVQSWLNLWGRFLIRCYLNWMKWMSHAKIWGGSIEGTCVSKHRGPGVGAIGVFGKLKPEWSRISVRGRVAWNKIMGVARVQIMKGLVGYGKRLQVLFQVSWEVIGGFCPEIWYYLIYIFEE